MNPTNFQEQANLLCRTCRRFGECGWCRATGGNFSLRIDATHCLITQSGKDKSELTRDDLMICDLDGQATSPDCRPSAETPLHAQLYRLDDSIGAIMHTHSVHSTLLSMHENSNIKFSGFEMQKALEGVHSHEETVTVPIFDNDQDLPRLAQRVATAWRENSICVPGFLVRGHGLYAWGADCQTAQRHVEGFEFLFACRWQEKLAGLA
jgi:methylthioribulose-1-phosphate dehydratase